VGFFFCFFGFLLFGFFFVFFFFCFFFFGFFGFLLLFFFFCFLFFLVFLFFFLFFFVFFFCLCFFARYLYANRAYRAGGGGLRPMGGWNVGFFRGGPGGRGVKIPLQLAGFRGKLLTFFAWEKRTGGVIEGATAPEIPAKKTPGIGRGARFVDNLRAKRRGAEKKKTMGAPPQRSPLRGRGRGREDRRGARFFVFVVTSRGAEPVQPFFSCFCLSLKNPSATARVVGGGRGGGGSKFPV